MFKSMDSYLVGYYGMKNSGDDALMYSAAWAAKTVLNSSSTSVGLFGDYSRHTPADKTVNLYFNQKFSGQNRIIHYGSALQSKRIIFGGGSVLHSKSDINLKRHLMSLSSAKNSIAAGISIGPFKTTADEKACSKFLNECGHVGVRDQKSLEIANDIAPLAQVKKTFDLAPLLLCAKDVKPITFKRKGIALALCPVAISPMGKVDENAENKRIEALCKLLETLYQNTGEPITLLTFNGHSHLGDHAINTPLMARLQSKIPVNIKPYNPDPFSVIQEISQYKALISMRLHGSVLGYLARTPVISLNYHEKCIGWCQQVGMAEEYQLSLSEHDINEIYKPIESGLNYGFLPPTLSIEKAINLSLSNWSTKHEQSKIYSSHPALQQS